MTILKRSTIFGCFISLLWTASAVAQQAAAPDLDAPSFNAIDSYLCNYNEGKSRADLDKVTAKWNKWMDKNGGAPYNAWIMTPVLTSTNMPIDLAWLGAWQNGKDMGKGMQAWANTDGKLAAEFDSVMTCGEHSSAASVMLRDPGEGWPGKSGVTVFSNCTVDEGKTVQDAMAAHLAWVDHLNAVDSQASMWAFFPGAGQNNPTWDYKIVTGFEDFVSYGAYWDAFTNGQGWAVAGKTFDGITNCDSQRVYQTTTVRDAGVKPY
jgi:hypothetical protein